MKILFQKEYARREQTHPMKVGIHKLNRGGGVGNSMNVHKILEHIAALWFSWKECDHALCIESDPKDRSDEDEYRTWCETACVDFPPVLLNSILFVSLACGHTNTGLRAIVMGCLSESLANGNGTNFDLEIIRKRDPTFAEAAVHGLWWTVIPQYVTDAIPELIPLFDASRNARGHVQTPRARSAA